MTTPAAPSDDNTALQLLSVFGLGPALIVGGMKLAQTERFAGYMVSALGLFAISYHAERYLKTRDGLTVAHEDQ